MMRGRLSAQHAQHISHALFGACNIQFSRLLDRIGGRRSCLYQNLILSLAIQMPKLYTKRGDEGVSDLYTGERRSKTDLVFHALGDLDELNAALGIARQYMPSSCGKQVDQVVVIQSRLFDVGSAIATPLSSASEAKRQRTQFDSSEAVKLETWIDELDSNLPPLTNFILPSGGPGSSHLHLARAICRRAERSTVPLVVAEATDPSVGCYINRLSDYLFVLARFVASKEGVVETIYRKA